MKQQLVINNTSVESEGWHSVSMLTCLYSWNSRSVSWRATSSGCSASGCQSCLSGSATCLSGAGGSLSNTYDTPDDTLHKDSLSDCRPLWRGIEYKMNNLFGMKIQTSPVVIEGRPSSERS